MAEHSPGPWVAVRITNEPNKFAIASTNKNASWGPVTHLVMEHRQYTSALQDANARLIAAAPALPEALEFLLPVVPEARLTREAKDRAASAIAQARQVPANA